MELSGLIVKVKYIYAITQKIVKFGWERESTMGLVMWRRREAMSVVMFVREKERKVESIKSVLCCHCGSN